MSRFSPTQVCIRNRLAYSKPYAIRGFVSHICIAYDNILHSSARAARPAIIAKFRRSANRGSLSSYDQLARRQ
jgi:hypothetical protein